MVLALQWALTIAGLPVGVFIKRLCQRLGIPPFPWRAPWIALLAQTSEYTLQRLQIPLQAGIEVSLISGILTSVAMSRCLVWLILELLPKIRILPTSPKILRDLIFIIGSLLLVALNLKEQARIDLVGLITTSAVLTAVLGLAAQDPLKDLIGGLSLQLEQVIREGDWVEIDGQVGRVHSISWRDTELNSFYGSRLIFPHTNANTSTIRNFTSNGPYGNHLIIGLDYSMPPHIAKELMHRISDNHPLILRSPPSIVRIKEFAESSINYEWINWQNDFGESRKLRGDLQEQLWYALQREGFNFPFGVCDVRLTETHQLSKPSQAEGATAMQAVSQLLKTNPLFSNLSELQIQTMVKTSSLCTYGPGEVIVKENELGDSLFMLIDGHVRITKQSLAGKNSELSPLRKGDIFGEMTVFTDSPRTATVYSINKADLLEVSRQSIAQLIEEEPRLIEQFGQLINARQAQIDKLMTRSESQSGRDMARRIKELFQTLLS